jgi:hypothetical protein
MSKKDVKDIVYWLKKLTDDEIAEVVYECSEFVYRRTQTVGPCSWLDVTVEGKPVSLYIVGKPKNYNG